MYILTKIDQVYKLIKTLLLHILEFILIQLQMYDYKNI